MRDSSNAGLPVLRLGFRPFFSLAMLWALLAIPAWDAYLHGWLPELPAQGVPDFLWHGHEMVFGYAMAVVTGFLLTAVRNWTGITTLHGPALGLLAALWLGTRIGMLGDLFAPAVTMALELAFLAGATAAFAWPVIRVRQWRQTGLMFKLLLMIPAAALFHLGRLEDEVVWMRMGVLSGLYLVLAILFFLAGAFLAPLPMMFLAIFTSFVQAFIFSLLTMLYISAALEEAH